MLRAFRCSESVTGKRSGQDRSSSDQEGTINENDLICTVTVSAHWKTGVEMEALNSVSIGLLCVLDMIKSVEKDENGQYPNTEIHGIRVLKKMKANGHV